MASQVLTDAKLYVASFDMSGDMNALALECGAEMRDATTFGQDTRIHTGGLKTIVGSAEGFWDADGTDEPDDVFFSRIGTANVPVTICPTDGSDGERAFLFRAVHSEYSPGAQVGDMYAFSVSMEGSDGAPLVRGTLLKAAGAVTATGSGTGRELGAVTAAQTLYGSLHVIAASGTLPTLDVIVESDDNSGFTSALTRLTFTQQTTIGSDWQTQAGAITDTYFRVGYTLAGTNPSFSFIVAVGIA